MEPKEYQVRALRQVSTYLQLLYDWRLKNDKIVSDIGEDAALDFPGKAWGKMEGLYRAHSPRRDGLGRYLPCFCLKIPTGGGKTFLAVKAIDAINTNYLKKRTGLVLWVVPTTQIYSQTIKSLRDRDHPYRQHLDIASGGRTVIITGVELNREEMIKLDLHVFNKASPDWKDTLLDSHKKLEELQIKAHEYEGQTGNHIRPICLIQVERTGAAQRGQGKIHSEDVREHLIQVIGIPPEEVAIKTSEKDELRDMDDLGGLLSRDCRIRYIITKQALQEGWDCAFAYVLAVLTNPGSKTALTQLVGRILRQPCARKTIRSEPGRSSVLPKCERSSARRRGKSFFRCS